MSDKCLILGFVTVYCSTVGFVFFTSMLCTAHVRPFSVKHKGTRTKIMFEPDIKSVGHLTSKQYPCFYNLKTKEVLLDSPFACWTKKKKMKRLCYNLDLRKELI